MVFVINRLASRAGLWETAEWERRLSACASFDQFAVELCKVFRFESCDAVACGGLIGLRLGVCMVADYSIDFRTRASQSSWNSSALHDAFHHGLADYSILRMKWYPMKGPPCWMEF